MFGDIVSQSQVRMLSKVIDHETVVAIVLVGGFGGVERGKIDSNLTTGNVAGNDRVTHPKPVTMFIRFLAFEGERLCRLCHDVGMIHIEKEDKSSSSFHAQGTQLAEGSEDLVGGGDGLVLLSRLAVAHVAVDRSALGRLPERSIVSCVASARRCRCAARQIRGHVCCYEPVEL